MNALRDQNSDIAIKSVIDEVEAHFRIVLITDYMVRGAPVWVVASSLTLAHSCALLTPIVRSMLPGKQAESLLMMKRELCWPLEDVIFGSMKVHCPSSLASPRVCRLSVGSNAYFGDAGIKRNPSS